SRRNKQAQRDHTQCSGNLVNFGAHCISTEAEETRPADSTGDIEEEKTTRRHAIGARKQSRKHSQHCNETPKEHDGVAVLKEEISTDQQSILIEADVPAVSAKKGQPEATPDHVSDTVPDNRTRCSCQYNDDDVDLTSGGGKECSGNKDCLSGERHAGTFQRNNTKDDPRAVDGDQANQGIGQRNKLHLLMVQIRKDATTLAANYLDGGFEMLTIFHGAAPDSEMFASD